MPLDVVFLDNTDSFTYNLVDEFARRGARVEVFRNDAPAEQVVAAATTRRSPRLLVISPGPGRPRDAGCCLAVVRAALGRVPLLGICLGHQALVEASGGEIGFAPAPVHGKASLIRHDGGRPFQGLPEVIPVGRYHSLAATWVPPQLAISASIDPPPGDGPRRPSMVMAVRHRTVAAIGLQFHPESILTPHGGRMIENAIAWARDAGR
jgi:anthranilate synthase component 2